MNVSAQVAADPPGSGLVPDQARARSAGSTPPAPRKAAPTGKPRKAIVWGVRALLLAVLLISWQVYGSSTGGIFVPSVTQTLGSFPELISSGVLAEALLASNIALFIGYPVSVVLGLALGFLLGRNRVADRAASYWLDIAMVVPMVAIVPVVIVALGLTLSSRVAVVILFTLPVIVLNSRAAVRVINQQLVEMSQAFGATKRQTWTSVVMPSALPLIFTGLSIGIGRAISGMIVVELILVPAGLGGLLLAYKSTFSGADLYAVTLVIIAEGVILTSLGRALEKRITLRMRGGKA